LGARAGHEVEFCQPLAFLLFSDQRGATVKLIDELEDRLLPLLWRSVCCKQPPDAEMRCSASFLRDEEIGGFLDTVVDKSVTALQPLDHLVTDRLPEMRVDLLLRCPVHESKRRDRCAVSQARQLLECLLCVDGQAVQLRDHEVHHVLGVPLGANAIEIPRPAPLAMIEGEQPLFRERGNELYGEKRIAGRLVVHQLRQRGDARRFAAQDRKSTRLNSSHEWISYAV